MKSTLQLVLLLVVGALAMFPACTGAGGAADGGLDGGADGDADADTDSDADGDADCENPPVSQDGADLGWSTCLVGQCLEGGECVGDAGPLDWESAQEACPGNSRLPTRDEFLGLLGNCEEQIAEEDAQGFCDTCSASAACDAIYPDVDGYGDMDYEIFHWSSTEQNTAEAWRVNFKTGLLKPQSKTTLSTLVCVVEE